MSGFDEDGVMISVISSLKILNNCSHFTANPRLRFLLLCLFSFIVSTSDMFGLYVWWTSAISHFPSGLGYITLGTSMPYPVRYFALFRNCLS